MPDAEGMPYLHEDGDWLKGAWKSIAKQRETKGDGAFQRRSRLASILLGQLVAFLASSTNASSSTLMNEYSFHTQFFQMIWMYMLLTLHLSRRKSSFMRAGEESHTIPGTSVRLRIPWWIYLFVSVLDVLPNFLTLLSLRYTSLTSTTLLVGSLTVPSTMIFSRFLLEKRFSFPHHVGVLLCLSGGCLMVWSDSEEGTESSSSYMTSSVGDLLAICAALIYGLGDAVAEYSIKHVDRNEYLGMLGLFGFLQTFVLACCLELGEIRTALDGLDALTLTRVLGILIWYVVSVFGYYEAESIFLLSSDATLLNLSLQASNFWAVIFSVTAYKSVPTALFFAALVLVVTGVFTYESVLADQLLVTNHDICNENSPLVMDARGHDLVLFESSDNQSSSTRRNLNDNETVQRLR